MLSALTSVMRRHVMPIALLLAALLALSDTRPANAIGEPTLTISMNNVALTAGTTSLVTFSFSASPIGFDNSDVNLADANGTLSPVTASPDIRVWTATYTPNAGVNDATNVISVGVQWTDGGGVSPLASSFGPNFTVNTASSTTGSTCPSPAVVIAAPNGGESLAAGSAVDVFWTANGCQAVAMRLTLSTDGGATFAVPVATSAAPFSGYYRWIVPDVDAGAARLQATLLGAGDVALAADTSDGDFVITPSPSMAVSTAPSPTSSTEPIPSDTTTSASAPPPEPPPPETTSAPTMESGTAPAPQETPPPATATAPAPTAPRIQSGAQPAPAPAPTAAETVAPSAMNEPAPDSTPINEADQPMPESNENQTFTIDGAQGVVETASLFAPSSMQLGFSFVLGALAMLAAMLGARKVMRDIRDRQGRTCLHCHGTGENESDAVATEPCEDCGGSGKVDEEEEQSVECAHCKGEGVDPCHECKGAGKDASGQDCDACRGGGVTLEDPEDEESEPAECEICGGEGEVGGSLTRQAACETCGGTGKV